MTDGAVGAGEGVSPLQRIRAGLRHAGRGLVRLALPPHCLACGVPVATDGTLCPACWGRMGLIERPFCERLAIPFPYDLGAGALSPEAIADPPAFGRMRAVALFGDVARQLVHGLKYNDHLDLAAPMAGWMVRAAADILAAADVIVPVPLHRRRLWWRRFNQSAALAGAVARIAGKPQALSALRRVRATRQQVGLGPNERALNVRGAFRVDEGRKGEIAGKAVVLVDDVYTTGATAEAATKALLRGGAKSVDMLVFARVARGGG